MSDKMIRIGAWGVVGILLSGYIFYSSALLLLASLLAFVMIFLCPVRASTRLLFFFAPLSYIFIYGQYNLFIFMAVAYILKYISRMRIRVSALLAPVLLAYCVIFADLDVGMSIGDLIYPILMCLVLFACIVANKDDYSELIGAFTSGFIFSAVVGLYKDKIPALAALFGTDFLFIEGVEENMDILRYAGLSYDPNFFALIDCILIAALLFTRKRITIKRAIQLLFLIVIGFFTFSKSYILMLAGIGIIYVIKRSRYVARNLILIAALLVCLGIVESFTEIKVLSLIYARFDSTSDANDLTTGRWELWGEYLSYIFQNPKVLLVGEGFNALALRKAAHNTYIDFLYRFGLLGTTLFLSYFGICHKTIVRKQPKYAQKATVVPLLVCLSGLMFLSAFHFQQFWCCICITMFAMYAPKEEV